jgi:hypothetical protein
MQQTIVLANPVVGAGHLVVLAFLVHCRAGLRFKAAPAVAMVVLGLIQMWHTQVVPEVALLVITAVAVLAVLLRQPQQAQAQMGRPVLVVRAAVVLAREVLPLA